VKKKTKKLFKYDKPDILAKEDDLEEEKPVYMQEIPNHPSCLQFSPNVHAHLHSGLCP
jgi:hypothetical protein